VVTNFTNLTRRKGKINEYPFRVFADQIYLHSSQHQSFTTVSFPDSSSSNNPPFDDGRDGFGYE
jgi:hypothetical protein